MTPDQFQNISSMLTSPELDTDLSKKHTEEINELKVELDSIKLVNEQLNGEVEKLIKEGDMMMQM